MIYEEIKALVDKQTDEQLKALDIGCWNLFNDCPRSVPCKYNIKGVCERGAVLTSTLNGAHPNDCPLRSDEE